MKLQYFTRQFYIYFFSFGGVALEPLLGGLKKIVVLPLEVKKWVALPTHYDLRSNAVIPPNKEDNQAPHPTISHFETDSNNSVAASFTRE